MDNLNTPSQLDFLNSLDKPIMVADNFDPMKELDALSAQHGIPVEPKPEPMINIKAPEKVDSAGNKATAQPADNKKIPDFANKDSASMHDVADFATGMIKGIPKAASLIVNGIATLADAGENLAAKAGIGSGNLLNDNSRVDWSFDSKEDTPMTRAISDITMYTAPFAIAAPMELSAGATVAADMAINFLGMDPKQERLSNLLQDHTPLKNYVLANTIMDKLKKKPNETELESRFKNMVEGLLVGASVVGAAKAVKGTAVGVKNAFSRGTEVANDITKMVRSGKEVSEAAVAHVAEVSKTPEVTSLPQEAFDALKHAESEKKAVQNIVKEGTDIELHSDELVSAHETPVVDAAGVEQKPIVDVRPKLTNDASVNFLSDFVANNPDEIAKYDNVTFEQLGADAQELLKNPSKIEELMNRSDKSRPFNNTETVAAGYLASRTSMQLIEAAKVVANGATSAEKAAFQMLLDAHNAIYGARDASKSMLGSAMGAVKISSTLADVPVSQAMSIMDAESKAQVIHDMMKYSGGDASITSIAHDITNIAEGQGPMAAQKLRKLGIGGTLKATANAADSMAMNGLLSSPRTTVGIILSQSMKMAQTVASGYTAALTNRALNAFKGTREGYTFAQANAQTRGIIQSAIEGIQNAGRHFIGTGGAPYTINSKFNITKPISGAAFGLSADSLLGQMVDKTGLFIGLPSRINGSTDAFFGTMAYRGKVAELAQNEVESLVSRGLISKAEHPEFLDAMLKDPPLKIHDEAKAFAEKETFSYKYSEKDASGKYSELVIKTADTIANTPVVRVMAPFLNATLNGTEQVFKNSPMALMSGNIRGQIMRGGREGDLALAKVINGTTMLGVAGWLAYEGLITGPEPRNYKIKNVLQDGNTGWQADSLHINDQFISFRRLDTVAPILRLGAVLNTVRSHVSDTEYAELATVSAGALADALTPEMMVSGMSDFLKEFNDTVGYSINPDTLAKSGANLAARYIPFSAILKDTSALMDGVKRDTAVKPNLDSIDTFIETVKNKYSAVVPWHSKDLPPVNNIWGEDIVVPAGFNFNDKPNPLTTFVSPLPVSYGKDEVITERLNKLTQYYDMMSSTHDIAPLTLAMPPRTVTLEGIDMDLTPAEYNVYVKACAGKDINDKSLGGIPPLKKVIGGILDKEFSIINAKNGLMSEQVYKALVGQISGVISSYREIGFSTLVKDKDFNKRFRERAKELTEEVDTGLSESKNMLDTSVKAKTIIRSGE